MTCIHNSVFTDTNKKAAKNTVAQKILDEVAAGTFQLPVVTRKRPASEAGGEGAPDTKTAVSHLLSLLPDLMAPSVKCEMFWNFDKSIASIL